MTIICNIDSVWSGENFFVCFKSKTDVEHIVQSELTATRAERSAEILNEHERNNARNEKFYWRSLKKEEVIPRGRRNT